MFSFLTPKRSVHPIAMHGATVPFWYRETRLQHYQKTYRVVDDGPDSYTPMEKSIMTSCVCTVGTKYPDVAAQIFTAKAGYMDKSRL